MGRQPPYAQRNESGISEGLGATILIESAKWVISRKTMDKKTLANQIAAKLTMDAIASYLCRRFGRPLLVRHLHGVIFCWSSHKHIFVKSSYILNSLITHP